MTEQEHKVREDITALIQSYTDEYIKYTINTSSIAPPINPVIAIINIFRKEHQALQKQVSYWKLSFNKQCQAAKKD